MPAIIMPNTIEVLTVQHKKQAGAEHLPELFQREHDQTAQGFIRPRAGKRLILA